MLKGLFFFLCLAQQGWTLYTKPWLGDVYEFEWQTAFTYDRYRKVEGARVQLEHPSNDKLLALDLNFTASPNLDLQAEAEFADTPRQSFSWRSFALQGRYLWLNDIAGDPVSLISGISLREVSGKSVRDVSSPYASYFNIELTVAAGKEWSKEGFWTARTYGWGALGFANQGAPWLKGLFVWEVNRNDTHRFALDLEGYFGLGVKQHVDVHHFHGWRRVHHQSIDLGIGYAYHMQIWGTFGLHYAYRLFAENFPEHVNFFTVFYRLPFSFF